MNQYYRWVLLFMIVAGCHGQDSLQDLPTVSWVPVDSVFSYHIEKDGGPTFKNGDLLGVELIGGIDKKGHQFIPVIRTDSDYAKRVTGIAKELLNISLDGKIRKNAEGYIKADLSRIIPDQRVVVMVYLADVLPRHGLDTLLEFIREMPEISEFVSVSKEEAKKRFIADGNADFSTVMQGNPLPASIELTIKEEYVTNEALAQLKQKLEGHGLGMISEVYLPKAIYPELRKIKLQDCVFHFKT